MNRITSEILGEKELFKEVFSILTAVSLVDNFQRVRLTNHNLSSLFRILCHSEMCVQNAATATTLDILSFEVSTVNLQICSCVSLRMTMKFSCQLPYTINHTYC